MLAPIAFNGLLTKTTSTLTAVTTAPTKGIPVVDLLSFPIRN